MYGDLLNMAMSSCIVVSITRYAEATCDSYRQAIRRERSEMNDLNDELLKGTGSMGTAPNALMTMATGVQMR